MEFAFDVDLRATIRVQVDGDLEAARAYLRDVLAGLEPGLVLPNGPDGQSGRVTELSLADQHLALYEAHGTSLREPVELDGMTTPVLCVKFDDDDGVLCEQVYDEGRGDGWAGECPTHADAQEGEPEELPISMSSNQLNDTGGVLSHPARLARSFESVAADSSAPDPTHGRPALRASADHHLDPARPRPR